MTDVAIDAVGIVLAAGAGTRFGMPKVLAADGEWLRRAVGALADGGCGRVIVVLGAVVVDVPAPATTVLADNWADGMSASLRAGLAACPVADLAVIHLVDTPDVGADVVARVCAAAQVAPDGIVRAVFGGRPGHPVVVAHRHWAQLARTVRGDEGAREFLRRHDVISVECGDLATGIDIDIAPSSG